MSNMGRWIEVQIRSDRMDEMAEQELLRPGQWIMCLGFGAGLTWGGAMFRW